MSQKSLTPSLNYEKVAHSYHRQAVLRCSPTRLCQICFDELWFGTTKSGLKVCGKCFNYLYEVKRNANNSAPE